MSVRYVNLLKENQNIIHFCNVCLYLFGKQKEHAEFAAIKPVKIQWKKQILQNHCSQTWYINPFSPLLHEENQMKFNTWQSWTDVSELLSLRQHKKTCFYFSFSSSLILFETPGKYCIFRIGQTQATSSVFYL